MRQDPYVNVSGNISNTKHSLPVGIDLQFALGSLITANYNHVYQDELKAQYNSYFYFKINTKFHDD